MKGRNYQFGGPREGWMDACSKIHIGVETAGERTGDVSNQRMKMNE